MTQVSAAPLYEAKDLAFEVPDGWSDKSVIAFAPSGAGRKAAAPSFVVTREKIDGETLRTFAGRQLSQMAKGLKDFKLRVDRQVKVSDAEAVQYEFSWSAPSGTIFQQITMALHEGSVYLFTATAPIAQAAQVRELFDRILASVQLRGPTPPPKDVDPPQPDWWPKQRRR